MFKFDFCVKTSCHNISMFVNSTQGATHWAKNPKKYSKTSNIYKFEKPAHWGDFKIVQKILNLVFDQFWNF